MIPNSVRFAVWALMVGGGAVASKAWLDTLIPVDLNPLISVPVGVGLLALIMWAARCTGRWLARYGKAEGAGFGEISRLVREGPYSCMRHPMHLFLSLFPIAVGLIIVSPSMALVLGPAETVLVLLMAVTLDERESTERFGDEYLEYRKEVPAFNLRPSCLVKALREPK